MNPGVAEDIRGIARDMRRLAARVATVPIGLLELDERAALVRRRDEIKAIARRLDDLAEGVEPIGEKFITDLREQVHAGALAPEPSNPAARVAAHAAHDRQITEFTRQERKRR